MNSVTVLMIANNEFEWVKASIESFRLFVDIEDIQVIVVDNYSCDGLRDWAGTQEDFAYVYIDEPGMGYGKIINEVRKIFTLQSDLFIIEGHFLLTPFCLSRMQEALYDAEDIGAVGCTANSFPCHQATPCSATTYEEIVDEVLHLNNKRVRRVLGLLPSAILIKKEALNFIGEFDEHLQGSETVIKDYCYRIFMADYKLVVCEEAVLWDFVGEDEYWNYLKRNAGRNDEIYLSEKWGMRYFSFLYNDNLIFMINEEKEATFSVLEIGCDSGATLMEIKNRYPNAEIVGCDINEHAVEIVNHFAKVFVSNIEDENLPCEEESFDYIIFGDVLEHLHNPKNTLEYCRRFLKKNGKILASIPNVMHISVVKQLLKGYFTYEETGLLDRTHIHLFTAREILRMFKECHYTVKWFGGTNVPISQEESNLIDVLLAVEKEGQREMYETFQYLVKAQIE